MTLQIQHVLLSGDDNPNYLQYLPITSLAWQKLLGIKPVFAYVTDKPESEWKWMYEYCEEIIKYPIWKDIPSPAGRTFCARLLIRYRYDNDVCMISDLDMIPLNGEAFNLPENFTNESLLNIGYDVFKFGDGDPGSKVYGPEMRKFPSCYTIATSNVFQEIINPDRMSDSELLNSWHGHCKFDHKEDISKPNFCDESLMRALVQKWDPSRSRVIGIDRGLLKSSLFCGRLDRANWIVDRDTVNSGYYIDAHCPRPLCEHIGSISILCDYLGIKLIIPPHA